MAVARATQAPNATAPTAKPVSSSGHACLINVLILAVFDIGLAIPTFNLVDNATGNHVYAYTLPFNTAFTLSTVLHFAAFAVALTLTLT